MKIKEHLEKFKKWYTGRSGKTIILNLDNDDIKKLVEFKPPCIAKVLNAIGRFWLEHWKWIIGTLITMLVAMGGLYIAYLQYLLQKVQPK